MVKIAVLALAVSIVLWVSFWLPKRLKRSRGARFRYLVFAALAIVFVMILLKAFL